MINEKLGRYEIVAELGQGAMGVVYKAIDPLIERTVAIKTIKLDLSRDELAKFEERFYREAKSAGRLNHPNVVTIYDIGKSGDIAYMAMEFLEGQALRDTIDSHTPLSIEKVVDIVAQVAEGLAYAHQEGVVHRDIKPANIMIVRDGLVKIMDFGIAHMPTGSRTQVGTVLGSPKYMSPEQVIGQTVDGRSDIFSLGVVLYEMLTGESPFDGDNISAIMYRILNEAPIAPRTLNPRVPEAFDYIVSKALAKHPDDRYQSAAEMAHDLRAYPTLPLEELAKQNTAPRTLERRAKPRVQMGDETLFLNQISGGLIGGKTYVGDVEPETAGKDQEVAATGHRRVRSVLMVAVPLVLAAFVVTLIVQRPAPPPDLPPPLPVTPTRPDAPPPPPHEEVVIEEDLPDSPAPGPASPKKEAKETPSLPAKVDLSESPKGEETQQVKGEAVIQFAITPWGEIFVDGQRAGVAPPLKELKLPAGRHKIEIRNLNFPAYSETMDLSPNATIKIKHKFQ